MQKTCTVKNEEMIFSTRSKEDLKSEKAGIEAFLGIGMAVM